MIQGTQTRALMLKLKLQYFGHLMRRTDSFEKTMMLGKIEGRRRRGPQRTRWLDGTQFTLPSQRVQTCMVILIASYDTGKHQDTLLNKTRFKVFIKLSVFQWVVRIVREMTTLNNKENFR